MTMKQAVILWASGCLTAVLMFAMFHTMLRTELVAARQMVVKSQKLHEDVRAILSGVPALMAGVEQAASGTHSLGQMVEHMANRLIPIEEGVEQAASGSHNLGQMVEHMSNRLSPLADLMERVIDRMTPIEKSSELAASGSHSLGQMVEGLANRVSPIERNTEQLVKQGHDTSARLEELITKVEALEKRLVNLGHRESNP